MPQKNKKCEKGDVHTNLGLLELLHGDEATGGVAGKRLLTVTDHLETRVKGDHLITVPREGRAHTASIL